MGIADLWNTTEQPKPVPKEILEEHQRLRREYQTAIYRINGLKKPASSLREAEEVARANLSAFERRHGLTSSDPRIG